MSKHDETVMETIYGNYLQTEIGSNMHTGAGGRQPIYAIKPRALLESETWFA